MKLAICTPDSGDACSLHRSIGPYSRLPIDIEIFDGKRGFFLWQTMLCDVVLLQRPWSAQHVNMAETFKAAGKPLIIDWDDILTEVPAWNPHVKAFANCKPHLEAMCKLADVVTVSTEALAKQCRSMGAKSVVVIRNAIDDSWQALRPLEKRNKVVAWRGSNTHEADLEEGRKTIVDMAKAGYEVAFLGHLPSWAYTVKHKHYGVVDYMNYLALLNSLAPEYLFVPLVDCEFNRCKSDIAAQEAYLTGCKLLHNNVGEFKGLPITAEPRWLSEVNEMRMRLLKHLTSAR